LDDLTAGNLNDFIILLIMKNEVFNFGNHEVTVVIAGE
jgi:hypothetical protein